MCAKDSSGWTVIRNQQEDFDLYLKSGADTSIPPAAATEKVAVEPIKGTADLHQPSFEVACWPFQSMFSAIDNDDGELEDLELLLAQRDEKMSVKPLKVVALEANPLSVSETVSSIQEVVHCTTIMARPLKVHLIDQCEEPLGRPGRTNWAGGAHAAITDRHILDLLGKYAEDELKAADLQSADRCDESHLLIIEQNMKIMEVNNIKMISESVRIIYCSY